MKRSYALAYIQQTIATSGAVRNDIDVDEFSLAEDILSAIERIGMLPPLLDNIDMYTEDPFTWEAEDEKIRNG